jgi:UDP-2,3-diacylglucosamine pyrophosphatase LpxH
MRQTVYVISDLHIGGAAASGESPGFQIFGARSSSRLTKFLDTIRSRHSEKTPVHLVVNGDSVDFLAEEPFEEFTQDDTAAERKLHNIMERSSAVWKKFNALVAAGAEVTFLLGNHDLELTLPKTRALFRRKLGPGRVELQFDNSALRIGSHVLIEHGNRYDGWNAVKHDALRRIRSAISRRETPEPFPAPPGSRMVIRVMNGLKKEFRFIDLLKPEQEGVIPLLVALRPSVLKQLAEIRSYKKKAEAVRYRDDGTPEDREMISAAVARERSVQKKSEEFVRAAGVDPEEIGTVGAIGGLLDRWRATTKEDKRQAEIKIAYEALQEWLGAHFTAFDTQLETPEYERAVKTSIGRGFRTVIYGHTHLAKRMHMRPDGLYLNTGTWAELMAVPRAILLDDPAAAQSELRAFLDDLSNNDLERWKTILPTYAKLELDGDTVIEEDVFVYQEDGTSARLTEGRLELLPVEGLGPLGGAALAH